MARTFSGAQLRRIRLAAGKKPEEIALRVDRSAWIIHRYERGTALPSVPVLAGLADELGCPVDAFFADQAVVADVA